MKLSGMVLRIKKGQSKKQIEAAVKRLQKDASKPVLADFLGKMKGKFGDGVTYQKELRNDWD